MRLDPDIEVAVREWDKKVRESGKRYFDELLETLFPEFEPQTFEHGTWLPEQFSGLTEEDLCWLLLRMPLGVSEPPEGWELRVCDDGFRRYRRKS